MTDDVLDFLRAQFAGMDAQFDEIARWRQETTSRLSAIERQIASVRGDVAEDASTVVDVRHRLDAMDDHVARIERRLDLVQP